MERYLPCNGSREDHSNHKEYDPSDESLDHALAISETKGIAIMTANPNHPDAAAKIVDAVARVPVVSATKAVIDHERREKIMTKTLSRFLLEWNVVFLCSALPVTLSKNEYEWSLRLKVVALAFVIFNAVMFTTFWLRNPHK